jgi:hypothetical protein
VGKHASQDLIPSLFSSYLNSWRNAFSLSIIQMWGWKWYWLSVCSFDWSGSNTQMDSSYPNPDDQYSYHIRGYSKFNIYYANRMNVIIRQILTLFVSVFDPRKKWLSVFISIRIQTVFIPTYVNLQSVAHYFYSDVCSFPFSRNHLACNL